MRLSMVIPTYNEKDNIISVIHQLDDALKGVPHELIVVDDNSPDGTAAAAEKCASTRPVRVIVRKNERGLGSAIIEGFRQSDGDVVGVIDADLQHPPGIVPDMVAEIRKGADIAIASRYVAGGGINGWPFYRHLVSRGATLLARPLTPVNDPMSGCFLISRNLLANAEIGTDGYKLLLEILVKVPYQKVSEVPYVFGCRERGTSKLGSAEFGRYLKLLWQLYACRLFSRPKISESGGQSK